MTNEQIIFSAQLSLLDAGKIQSTGRFMTVVDEKGEEIQKPEPEPIHTFKKWQDLGFSVKKGEKACISLMIWKHTSKQPDLSAIPENASPAEREALSAPIVKMFMKKAHFFAFHQVQPAK